MTATAPRAGSPRGVRSLVEIARRLEAALVAESKALGLSDTEALLTAIDSKRRILRELADATVGLRPEQLAADVELAQTLARCRHLNEISGSAIAALLHDTRRTLGLLGISAEPAMYGETGQSGGHVPRRTIATC